MRLPEYSLKVPIEVSDGLASNVIEFTVGTLIHPIWNEDFLPSHRKDELAEANRYNLSNSKYIMCIIGLKWVPIKEENIRKNEF